MGEALGAPLVISAEVAVTQSKLRWRAVASPLAVVLSVLAVHGAHLAKPLFWDDYHWYGLSDHAGWVGDTSSPGADVYRPLVAFWFAGMRWTFGFSPIPYHALALAFLITAALMVRSLGLHIGMDNVTATTSGVVYGAYGALTLTTIWASAAGGNLAVACSLAAMVLLISRSALHYVLLGAILFLAALLTREASIVTPALMMIVLSMPRGGDRFGWSTVRAAAQKTAVLWLVAAIYVVVRFANGAPADTGPYAARLFGAHIIQNAKDLVRAAARFGVPTATPVARVWDFIFWATVIVASLVAFRRGRHLPVAVSCGSLRRACRS